MRDTAGAHLSKYRLDPAVVPTHYDLTIKSDLHHSLFSGNVSIHLNIKHSVCKIILNAASPLQISTASLSSSSLGASCPTIIETTVQPELERCVFVLSSVIRASDVILHIEFEGKIGDTLVGYYRSEYPEVDRPEGQKYYALTQFEATAARQAFPCFDEPSMKSTFSLSMVSRKGTKSLSNCEELSRKPHASDDSEEWEIIQFAITPKMSTYLLAWTNGYFSQLEDSYTTLTGRQVPLRIFATASQIKNAKISLDVTKRVMPIYEKWFGIEYPLKKLDTLVADDFDAGAEENFGLITGRTTYYLWDEKTGSQSALKELVQTVVHEAGHQWFGNLATPEWWTGLWLKEGFATILETLSMAELYPEWHPHTEFLTTHLRDALKLDSLRSSHPIEVPCESADDANQIFDAISYSKGASVLKMLMNSIGQLTFMKGVAIYLERHSYGNADTNDLWSAISQASGFDVAALMSDWTLKMGYPVLTVIERKDGIEITQNRYLSTGDTLPADDQTLWKVPLEIGFLDSTASKYHVKDHDLRLESRSTFVPIDDVHQSSWKLNLGTNGVFRVLYDEQRLSRLGQDASQLSLSTNDRIGLLQDAFALCRSGHMHTSAALDLLVQIAPNEPEYLVFEEAASFVRALRDCWYEYPAIVTKLHCLARQIVKSPLKKLGYETIEGEDGHAREWRALCIELAAEVGDETTIDYALHVFRTKQDTIQGDLLGVFYTIAARDGDEQDYQRILNIFKQPADTEHRDAAIEALAAVREPKLIQSTFDLLDSDAVKLQDYVDFFGSLSVNPHARKQLFAYMCENLDRYVNLYQGNYTVGKLVKSSLSHLSSMEAADLARAFYADKDTSVFNAPLAQGIEDIIARARWVESATEEVEQWLGGHEGSVG